MSSRREGWTLAEFCLAWSLLLGAVAALGSIGWAQSATSIPTTQVTDTVSRADGTAATGTVLISWPAFSTAGGSSVPAGSTSVTLGAGGALSVQLVANAGSTPMGSYYTVVYHLDDSSVTREYWVVPAQLGAATVSSIRSTVVPASVALQTVSKAYVDTAIAAAVTGHTLDTGTPYVQKTGDTMTGALVLAADPTSALQASDKQYVDAQVAGVSGGAAQKVSLAPQTTQAVVQPVGTQLTVNLLNGVEHANGFVSGGGNNGIANAAASADCAGGCQIVADQTYSAGEMAAPTSWNNTTHVEDSRGGSTYESFFNPLPPQAPGLNAARTINVISSQAAQDVHAATGAGNIFSTGLVINSLALAGGSNQFPSEVRGAVPYFKSTYTGLNVTGTNYTVGQHVLVSQAQDCYGVGDCLMGGMYMRASGGFRDNADEGSHPFDRSFTEDQRVFVGSCAGGCATGATVLQIAATANGGTQGEGRFLIDTNPAKVVSTGALIGGAPTGGRHAAASFTGTSFPVSTFLESAQTIPSQANVIAPGTVTIGIVTSGTPAGYQASTLALTATSGIACVADVGAGGGGFETAAYTVVDGSHVQLTLIRPHASGATIAVGGLCGYGLEQTVDTVSGIRQVFPVIGSNSATSLVYAGGENALAGVQGLTSAFTNINAVIAAIARNANVVTVTTVGNLPADVNGLWMTVQGVTDSSYNGSYVVTTTGANTLTYALTGANSASTGGTISVLTGGFVLYPMAEVVSVYNPSTKAVDGQMTLAANNVAWAAGDAVELPHYFQEWVSADQDLITQFTPRATKTQTAGIIYSGNNGPGLAGFAVQNAVPVANYFGNGGTHTVPSVGLSVSGAWNHAMELQGGESAAIQVHCNAHGCDKWNSVYDLFQMDTSAGEDEVRYSPATSTLNFNLRGTGYQFNPTGLTAGTINVTTLNAGTVTGAFAGTVAAASLPVFGASGAAHTVGAVPDPGATAGVTRFLREDGTWIPAGGSLMVSSLSGFTTAGPSTLPKRASLLGEYLLAEGAGTVAHDTSGQGNDASITGGTWEGTTDLSFTDLASYIQLPTAVNQANTFQFAIYEPPFGGGAGPFPPGNGGETNWGANPALLCGTDTSFSCLISTSILNGLISPRFAAFGTSGTEACEPLSAGWHVVTFVNGQAGQPDHWYYDGAESVCYINQGTGGITHPATGHYQIGGSNERGGNWWAGKVAAAWAWSTSLSAQDVQAASAAATTYVQSKGGFQQYRGYQHATPLIVAGLDSLTSGCCGVSSPAKAWPANLTLTDTTYSSNVVNAAFAGTTTYDHAAMFDMLYAPLIGTRSSGPTVVMLWGGINDFEHTLPVRQAANALKAMVQKSKALGARVIVATPISNVFGGADANFKDVLTPLMRQEAFSWGADNVADLSTIAQLGADGAYANTTYFADGAHPSDVGELMVDAVFSNAVNELIGATETNRHTTAAVTYAEVAGDRYLDLTGSAAQAVTLPDCTGYSLPRQVLNLGTAGASVSAVSGQVLVGANAIGSGARAVFVPIPGAPAAGGCRWERTQ